jgi:pimeloyl-ACP methyl ester carboxylesterase
MPDLARSSFYTAPIKILANKKMEGCSVNQECKIDLGYTTIAGKMWGNEGGEPTIALHGYLDNANSFDAIAPSLSGLRIFAMDFAGHGWSDYRREGELYTGLNDIKDVLAVADKLGWDSFNIIGHSMGAEIGSQLAGLFPERVRCLLCIDGYCGTNVVPETIANLKSVIQTSFKKNSTLKVFPDFDAMTSRLCEATGQNATSARCLIERGHKKVEGGYTWITDPRIKGSGPMEMTGDQLGYLLDETIAETLFIVADRENQWLKRTLDIMQARDDKQLTITDLSAHHHLHMQEQADEVATLISDFIFSKQRKSA